jgi:hypothetical protein
MIALPTGTRIWLAAGITDMRRYAKLPIMRPSGLSHVRQPGQISIFGA